MVVNTLYHNAGEVSNSFTFDYAALAASLKRIYEKDFNPKTEIDKGLFLSILEPINKATIEGFGKPNNSRDADFLDEIKHNNDVWAAFKTHRYQNDLAAKLLDDKGQLKPFEQWVNDTQDITDHQVRNWLETEYNTAVTRANQAADWRQFVREADILPNLKWNPSTSLIPGKDHVIFWNRIWAMTDVHWTKHRPGDRWGCKCSLSATDEPVTDNRDLTDDNSDPSIGLGGNPGVTAEIFSKDHPYFTEAHQGAKKAVANFLKENFKSGKEQVSEKKFKSGGVLQTPKDLKQSPQEEVKNKQVYTEMAKMHGEQYKLLSIVNEQGKKNPDALNLQTGQYSDAKCPTSLDGKNAIQASIKSASKQGVPEVIIYLEEEYSRSSIYAGLKAALQGGRAKRLSTIIIRFKNGEIKRVDPEKIRQALKSSRAKNNK